MGEAVLIDGGPRNGRRLNNELAFRRALADGKDVYTFRGKDGGGVWFRVTLDGDDVRYTALIGRPAGV